MLPMSNYKSAFYRYTKYLRLYMAYAKSIRFVGLYKIIAGVTLYIFHESTYQFIHF